MVTFLSCESEACNDIKVKPAMRVVTAVLYQTQVGYRLTLNPKHNRGVNSGGGTGGKVEGHGR